MPHRIAFFCVTCLDTHKKPVEVVGIQVWIDEDKVLTFIGTCPLCEHPVITRASVQELAGSVRAKEVPRASAPPYLM